MQFLIIVTAYNSSLFVCCRSRGFGFVTFDRSECVDQLQNERPHELDGKTVDTKRVVPKVYNIHSSNFISFYVALNNKIFSRLDCSVPFAPMS